MNSSEVVRKKYKPTNVKVLLIGESPPHGETFFYHANSILYRAIKKGFTNVFGEFGTDLEFLAFFKKNGFYLDDLCLSPVNKLPEQHRRDERTKGIDPLAERIQLYSPVFVIILMKAIVKDITIALDRANSISIEEVRVVSFPVREKNRLDCIAGITSALTKLIEEGVISDTK